MEYEAFDRERERAGLAWPALQRMLGLSRPTRYAWKERGRVPEYAALALAAQRRLPGPVLVELTEEAERIVEACTASMS